MPGARAWSNDNATNSRGGRGSTNPPRDCGKISPGGIRAESCYVFPDGTVRRELEATGSGSSTGSATKRHGVAGDGGNGDTGGRDGRGTKLPDVPMPLVGTSRIDSADLSIALGIEALGVSGIADSSVNTNSRRRQWVKRSGRSSGGAYRGPGAAPGAGWVLGGRPPRAYIPFLNLPALRGKNGCGKGWRRHAREGADASISGSRAFSPGHSGEGQQQRGRPLAGIGGVLVSPGQILLTGPGRPATGVSGSSSRVSEHTEGEDGNTQRRRRRRGDFNSTGDAGLSDGGDSIGSGSTDVEFLRRRAETKLRSLERQEAADHLAGERS